MHEVHNYKGLIYYKSTFYIYLRTLARAHYFFDIFTQGSFGIAAGISEKAGAISPGKFLIIILISF